MSADQIEVFYDGRCGLCARSRTWAEARDTGHRLIFRDFTDPAHASLLPLDRSNLEREMVVRTPAGAIAGGFAGWIVVLDALPRWRWLGRALATRPIRWCGPAVYRFVARHRHHFPVAVGGGSRAEACDRRSVRGDRP